MLKVRIFNWYVEEYDGENFWMPSVDVMEFASRDDFMEYLFECSQSEYIDIVRWERVREDV